MNSPSGCITTLFAVVLIVVLTVGCIGAVYLFQSDAVSTIITNIGDSVSIMLSQIGKAILYIGIGVMGVGLLVGLGLSIRQAGPGINDIGEGIAKARLGNSVAKAIDEGRTANLPPVWRILERTELPTPAHQGECKLLESGEEWDGTIQVPTLRAHVGRTGRKITPT